jgi:hypothetical protein
VVIIVPIACSKVIGITRIVNVGLRDEMVSDGTRPIALADSYVFGDIARGDDGIPIA